MIVLDASAIIEFILRANGVPTVADAILSADHIAVPMVTDFEVLNALRKEVQKNIVPVQRAKEAVVLYLDMNLFRYNTGLLVDRIWQLRDNLTSYDASYVALAEMLNCPLYTRDRAIANAPGHDAQIVHIALSAP